MKRGAPIERRFGERMRMVRQARGLSASRLAERVGVDVFAVQRSETGQRGMRLGEAVLLCAALGVPLMDMIDPRELDMRRVTGVKS